MTHRGQILFSIGRHSDRVRCVFAPVATATKSLKVVTIIRHVAMMARIETKEVR